MPATGPIVYQCGGRSGNLFFTESGSPPPPLCGKGPAALNGVFGARASRIGVRGDPDIAAKDALPARKGAVS